MELISSFFPDEASAKGVDQQTIGIIFSFHPVGWFIVSMAAGGILVKPGMRKFLIKLSCAFSILGLLILLLIKWVDERWIYISLASLARLFTGMGTGLFITPAYSYLPLKYRDTLEQKIGVIEAMNGAGLSLGPIAGGALFQVGGYELPFYAGIGMNFICFLMAVRFIPDDREMVIANETNIEGSAKSESEKESKKEGEEQIVQQETALKKASVKKVGFFTVFFILKVTLLFFGIFFLASGVIFLDPTFAPYLKTSYELGPAESGMVQATFNISYMISCPLAGFMARKIKNNSLLIVIGFTLEGLGLFFLGPDQKLTGAPHSLFVVIVALIVIGLGQSLAFVVCMAQFIESIAEKQLDLDQDSIGNISSAFYQASQALGSFFGQFIAGFMVEWFSFPLSTSIFGCSMLLFTILYTIFGGVFTKKHRDSQNERKFLTNIGMSIVECPNNDRKSAGQSQFNLPMLAYDVSSYYYSFLVSRFNDQKNPNNEQVFEDDEASPQLQQSILSQQEEIVSNMKLSLYSDYQQTKLNHAPQYNSTSNQLIQKTIST